MDFWIIYRCCNLWRRNATGLNFSLASLLLLEGTKSQKWTTTTTSAERVDRVETPASKRHISWHKTPLTSSRRRRWSRLEESRQSWTLGSIRPWCCSDWSVPLVERRPSDSWLQRLKSRTCHIKLKISKFR